MRINHNISALVASNVLNKTNSRLDTSLERLSSGYRINRAADDAAGLAISEKMKTQIAGLEQASRNASDGISVIQTAEGALIEVETMLQRMRELSVQAANGVNTDEDRGAIQDEINQLNDEINRISETTEFNTKKLLNGTVDRRSYSDNPDVKLISLSDSVDIKNYTLKIGSAPKQAELPTKFNGLTPTSQMEEGKVLINGKEVEITEDDTLESAYEKLRTAGDGVNVSVVPVKQGANDADGNPTYTNETLANADGLMIATNEYGQNAKLEIYCDNEELANQLGLSTKHIVTGKDSGVTLDYTDDGGFNKTATVSVDGEYVTVTDLDNFEMKFQVLGGAGDVTVSVLDVGPMDLQIGANEGQAIEVRIPCVNTDTLGITNVNVNTAESSQHAITSYENAINEVSAIRAKLGAYQNRLEHAINSLDTSAENLTESLSRIADTDMAKEMAAYTQQNVLSQAGTAMLAQANERPQNILQLLQS